jgi:hypothetical protein
MDYDDDHYHHHVNGGETTSELWPPTSLLFIPHMMYEHGEPWWNDDASRGKLLTHLWQSYKQRHLGASRRNGWKKWGFSLASISIHTCKWYLHAIKSYKHEASVFTSHLQEGVLQFFTAIKKPSPKAGLNPWSLDPVASILTTTPPRQQTDVC